MSEICVGFIDVGFLRAGGAAVLQQSPTAVNPDAAAVIDWLSRLLASEKELAGHKFLRAYWYDGAFDPAHRDYAGQRRLFNAIARTPGIQLRLGYIAERPNPLAPLVRRALESTAADLGLEPSALLAAFNRHWAFRPVRQQKGVDTLIALDMVRLAQRPVYNTALLIAGDRDLAEAIRTVQDFGAQVIVATPRIQGVAQEVVQLADGIVQISDSELRLMLRPRSESTN